MFDNQTPMQHSDLPKTHIDEDSLGFEPFVKKVAAGIKGYSQKECFVISIEGQWGIGKTTFMNLVKNEIKDDVEILHFNPWLLTDIESLVVTFFSELMKVVNRISMDAQLKEEFLRDMKKFLVALSYVLPERVSLGFIGTKVTYNIGGIREKLSAEKKLSLDEQKSKINVYLTKIHKITGRKILIIIDDIDRLMDKETELIFRLIKGIADFDSIIYVLLFDREIITNSLIHFKSENGSKYLDKVIQYPLTIPKSHPLTITNMLREKLDAMLTELEKTHIYHFDQESWSSLYRILGRYIQTVRDVNKVFDTVSFEYESICQDVNFVDFFIITLIRIQAHDLYQFIKEKPEYFILDKAYLLLGYLDMDKEKIRQDLMDRIKKENTSFEDYFDLLQIIFPLFDKYDSKNTHRDHERKSISDSFYFDNYFTMSVSSDKLSYNEHSELVSLLINEPSKFIEKIKSIEDSKLQQFFEMFRAHTSDSLSNEKRLFVIENLVLSTNNIDSRDFRNDKTYCDFSWYSWSWIDLAAEEILKLENPKEALYILEKRSIEIQHRCYLRQKLEKLCEEQSVANLEIELSEYKDKHIKEIQAIDIRKFLAVQFLDQLVFCMKWLESVNEELKRDFEQVLFKDKESFFSIIEKFIYKQVSMPRADYPYSIQKSALRELVEQEKIKKYIDELDTSILSEDEQDLLNYWGNGRDFL